MRERTQSKFFYDDEIERIVDGEIYLKPGVHRKRYNDWINPEELEGHLNMTEYKARKTIEMMEELDMLNIDYNE